MMNFRKIIQIVICLTVLFCFEYFAIAKEEAELISLTYHDIVSYKDKLSSNDSITSDHLVDHFEWLKVNGYQPISIDDIENIKNGSKILPDKAVLLTWDDGYSSFYTHVFPLLKAYNYPAVLAIVGSWMAAEPDGFVRYGDTMVGRNKFMSWEQIQEIHASGLVEIASHSYDLHTSIDSSRFGDRLPAVNSVKYDLITGNYETETEYRERIRRDLQASSDQLLHHLGFRPRVIIWPYGSRNQTAIDIAQEIGMTITMSIDSVPSDLFNIQDISRIYLTQNPETSTFRDWIERKKYPTLKRFFKVNSHDLLEPHLKNEQPVFVLKDIVRGLESDFHNIPEGMLEGRGVVLYNWLLKKYSYLKNSHRDRAKEEQNFDAFIDRLHNLKPGMVVLEPVVTIDSRRHALFKNSRFPLAQDRLNRICWHTRKRAEIPVFLWLPSDLFVPKSDETKETIQRFFYDMGRFAPVGGVIIENIELVEELLSRTQMEANEDIFLWNPSKRRRARQRIIAQEKNGTLASTFDALEYFQHWQPFIETKLVLSIEHILSMDVDQFYGLLSLFDFLIFDMGQKNIGNLSKTLEQKIIQLHKSGHLRKSAFLVSAAKREEQLSDELEKFPRLNIINWGYQYDNFLEGIPKASLIRPVISQRNFPYPFVD